MILIYITVMETNKAAMWIIFRVVIWFNKKNRAWVKSENSDEVEILIFTHFYCNGNTKSCMCVE